MKIQKLMSIILMIKGINNYNVKNIIKMKNLGEKFDAYEKNLRKWHETAPSKDTLI